MVRKTGTGTRLWNRAQLAKLLDTGTVSGLCRITLRLFEKISLLESMAGIIGIKPRVRCYKDRHPQDLYLDESVGLWRRGPK